MYNFSGEQIKEAIDSTKSMRQAAKFLNVRYETFKKYADKFGLFKPNQSGKDISKSIRYKILTI